MIDDKQAVLPLPQGPRVPIVAHEVEALRAFWQAAGTSDESVRAHFRAHVRQGLARLRALWREQPQLFDEASILALRGLASAVDPAPVAAPRTNAGPRSSAGEAGAGSLGALDDARSAAAPAPALDAAHAGVSPTLDDAHAVLKDVFGYDTWRPGQSELIAAVLAGRDALGIMPTGSGKSLAYQVPARLLGGTTLVISPLVALMKDQVDGANEVGLRATFLNSTLAREERRERVSALFQGAFELVYAAPEGLETWLGAVLERARLSLIAVDEAHCISHWGHEFRPSYRNLQALKRRLGQVPVLALTATARPAVASDIVEQLGMRQPLVYVGSVFRPNLELCAYRKGDDLGGVRKALLAVAKGCAGDSGIVYCTSRKSAETTAEFLSSHGIRAAAYHAGLDATTRTRVQDAFLRDDVDVVVATVAFGMGIDKSNIRYVIHRDMPRSIEAYCQEVGRAGRDGLPSTCVLFYSWADVLALDRFADEAEDEMVARRQRVQAREMFAFAESRACRHEALARYLGEALPPCGASCDACTGRDRLAELRQLAGTGTAGKPRRRRDGLPALTSLTDEAAAPPSDADEALFAALKKLRKQIADERHVPAYVVFNDATLRAMASERPRTLAELAQIPGVGPKKLYDHGARFLEAIGGG